MTIAELNLNFPGDGGSRQERYENWILFRTSFWGPAASGAVACAWIAYKYPQDGTSYYSVVGSGLISRLSDDFDFIGSSLSVSSTVDEVAVFLHQAKESMVRFLDLDTFNPTVIGGVFPEELAALTL